MNRTLISKLPHPIASALLNFLDEELSRSADELSELFVAIIEYIGGIALADYLDGHSDPHTCASNPNLNSWLVSQLSTGKAEAGHWARWTQIAVRSTTNPAISCLSTHVHEADLDDPTQDIAWMLRFRNDVMHGGFVAPLVKIKQAIQRMERIFARLQPLWDLTPLGCTTMEPEANWYELRGLQTIPHDAPLVDREGWNDVGSVLLVDDMGKAVLAIHPGCEVDQEGWMHLQHAWKRHHQVLFHRPGIQEFFMRYQKERMGQITDQKWKEEQHQSLPSRGYVLRPKVEKQLTNALRRPGVVVRLVGPDGSGRSSIANQLSSLTDRPTFILSVEPSSLRMDPGVVQRWTQYTLSQYYTGAQPPIQLSKSRPNKKDTEVIKAWELLMQNGQNEKAAPILVIDDSDLIGAGIYQGMDTRRCFIDARRFGASILLIHRPSGTPPSNGDMEIVLAPWDSSELTAWGNSQELLDKTGGHAALLADFDAGMAQITQQMDRVLSRDILAKKGFHALLNGPASIIDIANSIDAFTPELELCFRTHLDHLIESVEACNMKGSSSITIYQLHPAISIALRAQGEK